eukprot:TRINITY_DN161_c0_g1_i2.p1 TRINITY_DN161_c0_g1~~TRINITY_DN161_c0_g1_i2.p1  ORF type:complete len:2824 (+),score=698.40 TRINITY_DN161_c0_g1_i2:73-8544(+)
MADEENSPQSYYASNDSNLTAMRPGQPPGRQVSQLQTHPTKDWVRRNAPLQKYDVEQNNFFFSGSQVIKSVGKDEGLTGVRCMSVVNERVWIGEREGCFSVWDFHTGERVFRSTKKKDIFVWSILGPVNGNFVWVASSDSFIRVFHAETMELIKEMKEHVGGVYCMVDTPGSRLVFSGSSDFTIVKWDGPKMERIQQFCGHKNNVRSLLVVGRKLFSGSDDNTIKVWDTQNGHLQQSWEDHTGGIHALAYACGKYVWSASEDKTIRVWNPDEEEPCVRVLGHPHTGQINCLSLIGSLMWSSSWNIVFVWDPETLELKGQYKNHEGCINALLPVHQAVVSRVWSASNDGVINLWDTECTFQNAMNAVSDGRLEEAMVQLEEAQKAIELEKKKMKEMEQICVQLGSEKDSVQFTMDSQKERYEQGLRDLRRQCAESTQRENELKAQLDKVGSQPSAAPEKYTDVPELLEAFQLGLEPGAEMPEEWRDEPGLSPEERARRLALREAFLKGKGSGPPTGSEKATRARPDHDSKEAYLKAALERAYRNGDVIGAHRLREYLDAAFPQWQDNAAAPIVPIAFLDEGKLTDQQRDSRYKLRSTFVEGLIEGSLDKLPVQPSENDEHEMAEWRSQRDAFLEGKDAGHIFPREVSFARPNRAAFARGLSASEPLPSEFKDHSYLPSTTRELRNGQRSAYLKARCAVLSIPQKFEDNIGLPARERENRRRQREHFLAGLAAGPGATLPSEYVDSVSDLTADVQSRKQLARDAFVEGQKTESVIPPEYTDKPGMLQAETDRLAKLRDAFLHGLIQSEIPENDDLPLSGDLEKAYKKGWIAGCPFDLGGAADNILSASGDGSAARSRRSYSLAPTDADTEGLSPEELERRRIMRDGLKYRDSLALVEKLEKECAALRHDNQSLLVENKETLNDLNILRAKIATFGNEASVRLDPKTLHAKEMAMIQNIAGENVEVIEDDEEEEYTPKNANLLGVDTGLLPKKRSGVHIKGVGVIRPQHLDDEKKEQLMSVVADHRQGGKSFLQNKGLIRLGGEVVAELPALDELDDEELGNLRNMAVKYDDNWESTSSDGGMNLPGFDDLEDAEQLYLKEIMKKHRNADGIRASSPQAPMQGTTTKQVATSSANAVISDAVANVLDADDVPEDLRKELKVALADDTEKTTHALKEVVQSSALPQVLKQQLLENVEEADKERVAVLTRAMQRATFDLKMPPDARKKLLEILEDGKSSNESTGQYADRLAEAARKAAKHQGTPEAVARYLKEALGEGDQQTADMYEQVKNVTKDAVLPQEIRLQLDDALAPPSRTHHVPEAIREILQTPESVPESLKLKLEEILDAHDARLNELSDTLAEEGFTELESTQSNRHNLPAAVHALAMHPSTTPEKQAKLMEAYNTHQGRTTATEDAAKDALNNMDFSPEARRALRTAVTRSGISNEDMVADAVRYALSHEGVPSDVCTKLQGGLNAIEGRQGELCHVAKSVISSADSSSKAVAALKPALDACESRTSQLVATISRICDEGGVTATQRRQLKQMSSDAVSRYTTLEEAVSLVAERSDLPEDVAQQMFTDLEKHASRGVALIDSLDFDKLQGLSPESLDALKSLDKHNPSKVSSTARSVLVSPSSDLEARRALYDALVVADDASMQLRDTAREGAHNESVPEDCRSKLKTAASGADASADALAAKVRQMLHDYGIEPAVRHSLHAALAEADSRYIALSETARSQGLQSELTDDERKALRNAVVAASGRSKELYHVARAAAHNTRVPEEVRQVLREALGEDMTTMVDGAMDAIRHEGVPEHHRKAIEIAIAEKDMKSADLADVVRDVLENEVDLSDSLVKNLGEALAPVDESNALVNEAAQKANLDVEIDNTEVPVVIGGESKSSSSKDHASVVRAALQSAGIRSGSRVDVYDALAEKEQKDTNLADAVKEAINKGTLPESALARLRAALEEKDASAKEVTQAVREAAVDPTVPLEARRLLADHKVESSTDDVEKTAQEVLTGEGLPEQQRLALATALEAVETRDDDLKNEIDGIAADLSPVTADALKTAKTADDVRDVLDTHDVSDDVREDIDDALAKYHGREAELAAVVDSVAHDVAVSPEVRSKMQTGHASGESIPTIQKVLKDPRVGESTKAALAEALDEAQEEEVSAVQRGKDHQMNRLKVELESKMDEMRTGFRAERRKLEDTISENSSLKLELDEYKRLIDGLGGLSEAQRLMSLSDSTKHMESLKQLREDELIKLEERIAEGGGVLAEIDATSPTRIGAGAGDGGAASSEAAAEDEARKRRLKGAYLAGQMATFKTPIPSEYRKYLAEGEDDEKDREVLTNMWLRGRQDAWGSVLPAEYADAEGLTEEDRLEREACRAAFMQGCGKEENPFVEGQMQHDAFLKGRQQRVAELKRAGADDSGNPAGDEASAFDKGLSGVESQDLDALLFNAGLTPEQCRAVSRIYGRGKWIRNDVLDPERSDSLSDTLGSALEGSCDRSRLAQALDELDMWHRAANAEMMKGLGFPVASPAYLRALQAALQEARETVSEVQGMVREEKAKLAAKEREFEAAHDRSLKQLESERTHEVDKLKGLLNQLESDLTAKGNVHSSLHNRIERLTEQLGKSSAENELLTQELIKKASVGDVTELVTYYKERERKWNELSQLNRELQVENKTLLTESTALAQKLRALSFVFESRPTLVRSLYELHKLLSHVPTTLNAFAKEAGKRQLPRLEILDQIKGVNVEVDTCKDGTRWIIANLFTSYELQHLGTSPQFFVPDGRRPTWRDIQVPTKQRELLFATWHVETDEDGRLSPVRNRGGSPPPRRSARQPRMRR